MSNSLKQNGVIPDYKKFDYLCTDFIIYVCIAPKTCDSRLFGGKVSTHLAEIKRLSEELNLTVPKQVEEWFECIGQDI